MKSDQKLMLLKLGTPEVEKFSQEPAQFLPQAIFKRPGLSLKS